jgi:hypothetical protein
MEKNRQISLKIGEGGYNVKNKIKREIRGCKTPNMSRIRKVVCKRETGENRNKRMHKHIEMHKNISLPALAKAYSATSALERHVHYMLQKSEPKYQKIYHLLSTI